MGGQCSHEVSEKVVVLRKYWEQKFCIEVIYPELKSAQSTEEMRSVSVEIPKMHITATQHAYPKLIRSPSFVFNAGTIIRNRRDRCGRSDDSRAGIVRHNSMITFLKMS